MTTNRFDEQAMNIRRAEIEKKLDENRAKINTLRTKVYELIRKLDELGPGLESLHKTIIDSTTHTRPKTADELYKSHRVSNAAKTRYLPAKKTYDTLMKKKNYLVGRLNTLVKIENETALQLKENNEVLH